MFKFDPTWLYLDMAWARSSADAPVQMDIASISFVTADMELRVLGRQNVYDEDGTPDLQRIFTATCLDPMTESNIDEAPQAAMSMFKAACMAPEMLGLPGVQLSDFDVVHLSCLGEEVPGKLSDEYREWFSRIGDISEDEVDYRF